MDKERISKAGRLAGAVLITEVVISCSNAVPPTTSEQSLLTPSPIVTPGEMPSLETPIFTPTPIPSQTPEITPVPTPETVPQARVVSEVRTGYGSEPSVAVSPYDKNLAAMSYNWVPLGRNQDGVRISQDGGKTWHEVAREPWKGQGSPDYHGVVAWGPGKEPGSSRLWWTDTVIRGGGAPDNRYQTVAYSDNLGKTWNFHIFKDTKPWIGGFPNLTVDNNPQSPNFGTAYVAYNYLEGSKGVGLEVVALKDGKESQAVNVPAPQVEGYPYHWRINYRVKTDSKGNAYVLFYQTSMRHWSSSGMNVFSEGGASNKGETAYYLSKLSYDENGKLKVDDVFPTTKLQGVSWGSAYDPETQSGFAIDQNDVPWMAFTSAGKIVIGDANFVVNSPDYSAGQPPEPSQWTEFCLSGATCFKPSLAVGIHNEIVVGFHAVKKGMVSTYFMVSYDNGNTWQQPQLVTKSTWRFSSVSQGLNGTGLREGMDVGPDGKIWYAYADNRSGILSTYVAEIDLGQE